jgi:hypothetical protein
MVRKLRRNLWAKSSLQEFLAAWLSSFWSFVAPDVLPLGKAGIKEIPNEQSVLHSMQANMPENGLYFLPGLGLPENATRGRVAKVKQKSGHPILIQASIDAVSKWDYQPFLLNGQPPT